MELGGLRESQESRDNRDEMRDKCHDVLTWPAMCTKCVTTKSSVRNNSASPATRLLEICKVNPSPFLYVSVCLVVFLAARKQL